MQGEALPENTAQDPAQENRFLEDPRRRAWAELISRQNWHWFLTLTFRPEQEGRAGGCHPEKASKAARFLFSSINRERYGPRWHKKEHGGIVWVTGDEFHKSGRIHLHCLAACPVSNLNEGSRRLSWMDFWHANFGIARIERPQSQDDVCSYVSKYVVKDGEINFSRNFGKVQPPSLFAVAGQESGPG